MGRFGFNVATRELLGKLRLMAEKVKKTTKTTEKIAIVKNHKDLHDFLRFFNSCGPLYLTSKTVLAHKSKDLPAQINFETLQDFLEALNTRACSGHAAIEAAQEFLNSSGDENQKIAMNILDRDLEIGMGKKLMEKALDPSVVDVDIDVDVNNVSARHVTPLQSGFKRFPVTSKDLPVALGLPLQHPSIKLQAKPDEFWLISRKLDGIRCLAHYDGSQIKLFTRAGNILSHFQAISQELLKVASNIKTAHPEMTDFYFDGELCVLAKDIPSNNGSNNKIDHLEDDFRAALSIVLSKPTEGAKNIPNRLVFFAFDLFDRTSLEKTILSERLKILKSATEGHNLEKIHILEQHRTNDPFEFRKFVNVQKEHKWEGLIIRRDAPFVPKRTRDIIKVKDFFEAEFTITDYRLENMQTAVNGEHLTEELLSSVKIDFGGVDVWVGSGLTLEERRKYRKDPAVLIGSQVTVRYFQESSNKKRDGLKSLRFPTIKAIHQGVRKV
jgi:DNA ligase-1